MTNSASSVSSKRVRSGITGNNVIFVGGIPRGATQKNVRSLFNDMTGDVEKVRFVMDKTTRCHRGYGFVRFGSDASAAKVLAVAGENDGGIPFGKGKLLNVGCTEQVVRGDSSDASATESTGSGSVPSSPVTRCATMSVRTWQPYQDVDIDSSDVCYSQPRSEASVAQPAPASTYEYSYSAYEPSYNTYSGSCATHAYVNMPGNTFGCVMGMPLVQE